MAINTNSMANFNMLDEQKSCWYLLDIWGSEQGYFAGLIIDLHPCVSIAP